MYSLLPDFFFSTIETMYAIMLLIKKNTCFLQFPVDSY